MLEPLVRAIIVAATAFAAGPALASESVTYLFPAPDTLPAFVPFQLAKARGYYKEAGLDVTFRVGKGGADVAKQVGVANADLGGGLGDSPIIVRANGVPVQGVALLGGGGLTQIIVRADRGVNSLKDLKGKRIGVVSFQNTNYYALLPVLAHYGISPDAVSVEAVGQAAIIKLMVSGDLDAISNVPENATQIEAAGVKVKTYPVDDVFPAMAQAILASDAVVKERPDMIRRFVGATLRALRDCIADPKTAARDYVAAVPEHKGQEAFFEDVLQRYDAMVYKTANPADLGKFDRSRMAEVQDLYLKAQIIRKAAPVDELFTNQFVD